MAEVVTAITEKSLSDTIGSLGLITALNNLFSGLLENNILGFNIIGADKDRKVGRELSIIVKYEDAGDAVLTDPFIFSAFTGKTAASVAQQAEDFIAAAGADFTAGPVVVYLNIISPAVDPYIALVVSCADSAGATNNWKISFGGESESAAPSGAAGGDLSGSYPNPSVTGIQGTSVPSAPSASGQVATFDGTNIVWNAPLPTFASLAAAAAAQPQVVGSKIVIYPGSPTSDAGTYVVNSNTGVPGTDYTKTSDLTDTAAEVSVADADALIGASDVESALREIRGPVPNTITASGGTIAKSNFFNIINLTIAGASTTMLPAAPVNGETHVFKDGKGDATTNVATIDGNGNTIDGAADVAIQNNFGALAVQWNGTEWSVIYRYIPADIFSTSETITNKKWIDGKPIYRKVIDMGAGPNVGTKLVAHGITGIDTWLSTVISADNGTVSYTVATVTSNERVFRSGADISWTTANDRTTFQGYAIVEYTKT